MRLGFFEVLVLVVIGTIVYRLFFKKPNTSGATSTSNTEAANMRIAWDYPHALNDMPNDIGGQITALAQMVQGVYEGMPFVRNEFAKGNLSVWKNENDSLTLSFWYDWDYSAIQSYFNDNIYKLDDGFRFKDSGWIEYRRENITAKDNWCWNGITRCYTAESTISQFSCICPAFRLIDKREGPSGFTISFSC